MNKEYIDDKKDIFILQYPSGNDLSYSLGQIRKINNPLIYHNDSTEKGSSGSPIIDRGNNTIIGIHFGGSDNINFAYNIDNILMDIKKNIYTLIQ